MKTTPPRTLDENTLTAEEQAALRQLMEDYANLMRSMRGLRSGMHRLVAIALIQDGWRKQRTRTRSS